MENSIFVLCKSGRVLYSKSNNIKFKVDVNLFGKEIVCLSGTSNHCIAVTKEGRVFACSSNEYGQLGLYTKGKFVKEFTEISSLKGYEIQEAYAGHYHSLFMTRDGKIFSCGNNKYGELLLNNGPTKKDIFSPRVTMVTEGATFCIAGNCISAVFVDCKPPPNVPNMKIQHHQ